MVELITKHYNILGIQLPIELKFYVLKSEKLVVARYTNLDFTVSTTTGEMMDNCIKSGFESIFKCNMKRYNINNFNEYLEYRQSGLLNSIDINQYKLIKKNESSIVLIQNPDKEDEGFMIGTITCNN